MRSIFLSLSLAVCLAQVAAQQAPKTDAASIMAQVAANQDRSEAERAHYLYIQHARVTSSKGNTVRCEEITDSRVIPSESGSQQQLLKLDGRLLVKHVYQTYTQLPTQKTAENTTVNTEKKDLEISIGEDEDTDRSLVEQMRNNLTNTESKDGIGAGLFPLTTKSQAAYQFHLLGKEHINGREVFHIAYEPSDKSEFDWKGDAYIDTSAYQPVVVRTALSRKIPFAVRTLLGTNLPGLGFTVIYAPQKGDVWFPVSFGTEFKIKVLFFFSRNILISAQNSAFEQTHVTSKILPADAAPTQP
jgi:hypothetical protein